jgi:hypothetical protein
MDVVLHVGAHRTASTTFQKTLGASGPALAQAGVVYWGPKCTRSGLFDGLIGAPERLDPARRLAGLRRVARRARRAERAGARILLISEENVLGSMRAAVSGGGFYADAGPRVAAVAEAFGTYRLTIAMAVRAQDAWWRSARAFCAARDGSLAVQDGHFARQPRGWRDVIGDIAEWTSPCRIAVWSHEAMCHRPEAVAARLDLGEDVRGLGTIKNASGPARAAACDAETTARLRRRYTDDLDWLRSGAGGLAEFIDTVSGHAIPAMTGQGRGMTR